jgi:ADP-ribose pyrophosphatase YjhB (NUDIX family)
VRRATRYQGAIVRDEHVLLLKVRERESGETFWVMPGGGQEPYESEEACVQREVREETMLEVKVLRVVLDESTPSDKLYSRHKTYLCRIIAGEARPGTEPEVDSDGYRTIRAIGWFDLRAPET